MAQVCKVLNFYSSFKKGKRIMEGKSVMVLINDSRFIPVLGRKGPVTYPVTISERDLRSLVAQGFNVVQLPSSKKANNSAEEEAKAKAEEEARKKAEEEAKQKAEEEARVKAEEEAKAKAEEEARKRKAEEEAKAKAEETAKNNKNKNHQRNNQKKSEEDIDE